VDRLPAPPSSSSSRAVDDVLRRIPHEDGSWSSLLFVLPLSVHMRYVIRIHFAASNNVTEYEALVNGLKIAIELGVRRLDVRGDSQLVIDQVMKASSCYDPKMEAHCKEVRRLEDKFCGLELIHVAGYTTRQPTNSSRSRRLEARSRPTHSQETYTSHPSTWARWLTSKPPPPSNQHYQSPASGSRSDGGRTASRSTVVGYS